MMSGKMIKQRSLGGYHPFVRRIPYLEKRKPRKPKKGNASHAMPCLMLPSDACRMEKEKKKKGR
jgi:hypothetical protein